MSLLPLPPQVQVMNKRAAEGEPEGAPASKGQVGARAENVINPIPRNFKQNFIQLHFTQRTFEELGAAQLKWVPSSQYWAAMLDKFHYDQFMTYYPRCSSFEIHHPKVRISNLLMLQDSLQVTNGTPSNNTIYTQACYLMHYEPKGIKNWFKLGDTDDCGKTQKILTYNPMKPTDCKYYTQLIEVGSGTYADFERLVINPCNPDLYAGFKHNADVRYAKTDPSGKTALTINDLTSSLKDYREGYITNTYISPNDIHLGNYSCSAHGMDKYIPLMKHTTFCRNLDKVSLHKYGDVLEWEVNTNLEGVKLLQHKYNLPYGGTDYKIVKDKEDPVKEYDYVFCYPSTNRPFYTRKDNLYMQGPMEHPKEFAPLKHHFLTMPPIRQSDGSLIFQRCSFIMEQSCSVTFHFPETVSESDATWIDDQKDGVVLRPMVVKAYGDVTAESPKTPPDPEPEPDEDEKIKKRDELRQKLINKYIHKLPGDYYDQPNSYWTMFHNYVSTINQAWRDIHSLVSVCVQAGEYCVAVRRLLLREAQLLAPQEDIPFVEYKYDKLIKPFDHKELTNTLFSSQPDRPFNFFGYLFYQFCRTQAANHEIMRDAMSQKEAPEMPDFSSNMYKGNTLLKNIANEMYEQTEPLVNAYYESQCMRSYLKWHQKYMPNIRAWKRDNYKIPNGPYDDFEVVSPSTILPTTDGYFIMNMNFWYQFCADNGIILLPQQPVAAKWSRANNSCVEKQIDELFPPIKKKEAKPQPPPPTLVRGEQNAFDPNITNNKMYDYSTSLFFV